MHDMSTRHARIALVSMLLLVLVPSALVAQPPTAGPSQSIPLDTPTKKEQSNPYNAKNQLDLNSASKTELMKLPGIGDATADAIIKNRPYTNKTQIKTKAGVAADVYDKIADMIVAKQAK
jgi:DNA uptake protein ComE-like DNA-binding protein